MKPDRPSLPRMSEGSEIKPPTKTGSRSRFRDALGAPVRDITLHMTPRQAEQFYDALWKVACAFPSPGVSRPWPVISTAKLRHLDELRRRIVVAADLEL